MASFDIFKVTPDGPLWVEAVSCFREAKERMTALAQAFPAEYFIHSEGNIVAKQAQEWAEVT